MEDVYCLTYQQVYKDDISRIDEGNILKKKHLKRISLS